MSSSVDAAAAPTAPPARPGPAVLVPNRVSLARASLLHDWRRYFAAVLAVAFSGLLVIIQLALLLGLFGTVTTVVDNARADLWTVDPGTRSFDLARELSTGIETRLRSHPDIERVEPMTLASGDWRTPLGQKVLVTVIGLDVSQNSIGFPRNVPDELRLALQRPGAVLIDDADLDKLGMAGSDPSAEINGRRVDIVGVTTGYRSVGGATVFASEATLRDLRGPTIGARPENPPFYLLRLAPGVDAAAIAASVTADASHVLRLMSAHDLSVMSQLYWMLESGTGAGFLFSTLLGLIVGVAITSQTLRAALLASLREFATLRALGVPLGALRAVVLEQSLWIGLAGLALTVTLCALGWWVASVAGVAFVITWWAALSTGAFTLVVSLVSGLLSLGPLLKTEPAELLR